MEVNEAGREAETTATDLTAILADGPSSPAPVTEQPQAEAAPAVEAPQAAPEAKPEPKPEAAAPSGPKWYRDSLEQKERRARDAERQAHELRQQLEQRQHHPAPQPVDYSNPQAMYQTFEQRLAEAETRQTVALSARFAQREHGAELFEEASVWLSQRPDLELWAQAQPDPWGAAIQRFKQERLADEIGDDPAAYREKLRQELLAELQQQQGQPAPGMMARPQPHIPAPASGARSAAPRNAAGQFTGPTPLTDIIGQR